MILIIALVLADEPTMPEPLVELPTLSERESAQARHATAGFRTSLPAGPGQSTRLALVEDFDGAFIFEGTTRLQTGFRWASIAAELAGTGATSEAWSGSGLGNLAYLVAPARHLAQVLVGRIVGGGPTKLTAVGPIIPVCLPHGAVKLPNSHRHWAASGRPG